MMKWFISCLIIIYFGLGISMGLLIGLLINTVDEQIEKDNRASLLTHYNITED